MKEYAISPLYIFIHVVCQGFLLIELGEIFLLLGQYCLSFFNVTGWKIRKGGFEA
jgi:hypothetical protein